MEIVSFNDNLKAALRPSTILKYKIYQTKWNNYCMQNNISHKQPKISELLNYFTRLYSSVVYPPTQKKNICLGCKNVD